MPAKHCDKCGAFITDGQPCKRCGEPAPEIVRCDRADVCGVIDCYHAEPHKKRGQSCRPPCALANQPNAKCVPVPTAENTFGPVKGIILPDSPAECAECAKLRAELAKAREEVATQASQLHGEDLAYKEKEKECAMLREALENAKKAILRLSKQLANSEGCCEAAVADWKTALAERDRERAIVDALLCRKEA